MDEYENPWSTSASSSEQPPPIITASSPSLQNLSPLIANDNDPWTSKNVSAATSIDAPPDAVIDTSHASTLYQHVNFDQDNASWGRSTPDEQEKQNEISYNPTTITTAATTSTSPSILNSSGITAIDSQKTLAVTTADIKPPPLSFSLADEQPLWSEAHNTPIFTPSKEISKPTFSSTPPVALNDAGWASQETHNRSHDSTTMYNVESNTDNGPSDTDLQYANNTLSGESPVDFTIPHSTPHDDTSVWDTPSSDISKPMPYEKISLENLAIYQSLARDLVSEPQESSLLPEKGMGDSLDTIFEDDLKAKFTILFNIPEDSYKPIQKFNRSKAYSSFQKSLVQTAWFPGKITSLTPLGTQRTRDSMQQVELLFQTPKQQEEDLKQMQDQDQDQGWEWNDDDQDDTTAQGDVKGEVVHENSYDEEEMANLFKGLYPDRSYLHPTSMQRSSSGWLTSKLWGRFKSTNTDSQSSSSQRSSISETPSDPLKRQSGNALDERSMSMPSLNALAPPMSPPTTTSKVDTNNNAANAGERRSWAGSSNNNYNNKQDPDSKYGPKPKFNAPTSTPATTKVREEDQSASPTAIHTSSMSQQAARRRGAGSDDSSSASTPSTDSNNINKPASSESNQLSKKDLAFFEGKTK